MFNEEWKAAEDLTFRMASVPPDGIQKFFIREQSFGELRHIRTILAWFDNRASELKEVIQNREEEHEKV